MSDEPRARKYRTILPTETIADLDREIFERKEGAVDPSVKSYVSEEGVSGPFFEERPVVHGIYEHFRSRRLYMVTSLPKLSDGSGRECVVYLSLYSTFEAWVRPLSEFVEIVRNESPRPYDKSQETIQRFTRVTREDLVGRG